MLGIKYFLLDVRYLVEKKTKSKRPYKYVNNKIYNRDGLLVFAGPWMELAFQFTCYILQDSEQNR